MKSAVALVLACILLAWIGNVESVKPFKFQDCNPGKGIANITRFTVSPEPLSLSKNITATVDINLFEDIPPNAQLKIKVFKVTSLFGVPLEVPAPCVGGLGSCTTDPCKFLNRFKDQACPFFPSGVECGCPLKAGHFGGESITIPVPQLGPLIKWIASGDFKVVLKFVVKENYKEKTLLCYSFTGTARP